MISNTCPSCGYWNGYPSGDERERLWLDEIAITDKLLLKEAKVSLERLERAETVERERNRLWKALRYYADFHEDPNDGPWGANSQDFGKVARAALRGEDYDQ